MTRSWLTALGRSRIGCLAASAVQLEDLVKRSADADIDLVQEIAIQVLAEAEAH